MKLALHIGTAKTGTTTLQRWFSASREGLARQGVIYATAPGAEDHRKLMIYARDSEKPDGGFAKFGIRTAEDHAAFRARFRADLTREAGMSRARGEQVMVMSCEHLHSKLTTVPMIERLRDLLAPLFAEITVYLHLRPQVDLLISNASQRARMGQTVTRAELSRDDVSPRSNYFNYYKMVGFWEDVFGARNLRIIPFRRYPDITALLIEELGLDMSRLPPVMRQNGGLDWRAMALANVVNAGFALKPVEMPDLHLDGMPGTERLQLGQSLARELQDRFSAVNQSLADHRPDITLDDLTPDWSQHAETGNLHLLEAPCLFGEQLSHMVRRLAQDRALERWRRHIAEGRLAALTGDAAGLQLAKRLAEEAAAELSRLGLTLDEAQAADPDETAATAA